MRAIESPPDEVLYLNEEIARTSHYNPGAGELGEYDFFSKILYCLLP